MFENRKVACCKGPEHETECVCSPDERVIRAYIRGDASLPPMTAEEREWCLDEADRSGEGAYPREEAEGFTDQELAKRVLNAWNDYVRSNCM